MNYGLNYSKSGIQSNVRLKNSLILDSFSGKVVAHAGRGKGLGFPTANVLLTKKIPAGIYISQTRIQQEWHPSVTFIGVPITFAEDTLERAETYILKGDFELAGTTIAVELLQFIRENKKFDSVSDLVAAIQADVTQANDFFLESA